LREVSLHRCQTFSLFEIMRASEAWKTDENQWPLRKISESVVVKSEYYR